MAGMDPLYFASAAEFGAWLTEHHATETAVYVGYWKKATGRPTLTWPEAVDEALRFGWIDGVRLAVDDERHAQRFTPRMARSTWSLVNVRKAEALITAGRMEPAGLAAFEARRSDNTGIYSFERAEPAALETDEEAQFRANAAAWEWFEKVAPSYRKAALHWVVSAKQPQTRIRRLATLIEDSAAGLRIKPMRR